MYIWGTILILPAIIFALIAQLKVSSAFDHFSQIPSSRGITAADLARRLLDQNGCNHVAVTQIGGHLSDHYDPRKRTVALSQSVYASTSIAALGIAAHEVGHAIQHQTHYAPLMLRQLVIKSTGFVNKLLMPLIIIGLIASLCVTSATIMGMPADNFWFYLILAFAIIYSLSFIVNLITLPTEYNASSRAKKMLAQSNFLSGAEEQSAVARVLGAAALTYLASLIVSFAYMLRFVGLLLSLTGRRN